MPPNLYLFRLSTPRWTKYEDAVYGMVCRSLQKKGIDLTRLPTKQPRKASSKKLMPAMIVTEILETLQPSAC
jgi:hypothetical protein